MKVLSEKEYARFAKADRMANRVYMANRWLAEFDDMLMPVWDYIVKGDITIAEMREKLRKKYEKI